jgi:hypothetical protein
MATIKDTKSFMRVVHRYLGYFLAGIMAVYAISGIVLVYRDTDFLKTAQSYTKTIDQDLPSSVALGKQIGVRDLEYTAISNDTAYFKNGWYVANNGHVFYTKKELPFVMDKLVKLHKAKSANPLSALNVTFGLSLLFFVISSFWMFQFKSKIFKKGLLFTTVGLLLAIVLLFV